MLQTPTTVTLNGTLFNLFPLTDEDNELLHEYVRKKYLDTVVKATSNLDIIGLACDRIQTMLWTREPGNNFMIKRAGIAKLMEVGCRNPLAYAAAMAATKEEIANAFIGFRRVNSLSLKDANTDSKGDDTVNP